MNHREACRKAHQTPNPAPAADAMRTRFERFALALINFRYLFGPKSQRRTWRLGINAPIIPSPIIIIAAISLNLLPIIESFRYLGLCFDNDKMRDRKTSLHCHAFSHVKIRSAAPFCRYGAARIKDSSACRERIHRRRFPSSIIFRVTIPPGVSILELLEQIPRRRFDLRAQFQRVGVKHIMTP
jgi:hypothetical protein